MKHRYLPIALALLLAAPAANAQSKFDSRSQIAVDYYKQYVSQPGAKLPAFEDCPIQLNPNARGASKAKVLVILNPGTTADDLERVGLEVIKVIGDVAVCDGTMDDILALSETDLPLQISFDRKATALLDKSREATGVSDVHLGTGLQQAYDGAGVMTGIFDIGMDPNHLNFKDADGYTRISDFWYFSPNGTPTRYSWATISGFTTDSKDDTHGTHTMGCMAGSYNGAGKYGWINSSNRVEVLDGDIPYYGMAPGAEILGACGISTAGNILLSLTAMRDAIRNEYDQPGLLSLSFGNSLGPHDGTDAETRALNAIAKDIPLFIAAGNEGDENISIVQDITDPETEYGTILDMSGSKTNGEIQIWGRDDTKLTLKIVVYDRISRWAVEEYEIPFETTTVVGNSSFGNSSYLTGERFESGFTTSTVSANSNISQTNNRWNATVRYSLNLSSTNAAKRYNIGVVVMGPEGSHFDMVHQTTRTYGEGSVLSNLGNGDFIAGGNQMSISNMACGPDMLCIGAYNTRKAWPNLGGGAGSYSGSAYAEQKIAPYSSYGLLADGTTLPLVCAPGTGIISSVSQYWVGGNANKMVAKAVSGSKTSYWDNMQGTSMATPVAAGIAALWLQANPDLTPDDIRNIIRETSTKDNYVTGNTERPQAWGAGKINALEGIKRAVGYGGVGDIAVNPAKIVVLDMEGAWQVVAPGASKVSVTVYDMNGRSVLSRSGNGDTLDVPAALQPGIYVMNVNNLHTQRVVVR